MYWLQSSGGGGSEWIIDPAKQGHLHVGLHSLQIQRGTEE